jgi:hypothetical protein
MISHSPPLARAVFWAVSMDYLFRLGVKLAATLLLRPRKQQLAYTIRTAASGWYEANATS